MTAPPTTPSLDCEIVAPSHSQGNAFAEIARVCARDVGQVLRIRRRRPVAGTPALLVLHLPAALAATQHPVWCLACRLACFCPDARVSVSVACREAFDRTPRARRAATRRAA